MTIIRFGILSTAGIAQKQFIPAIERAENAEAVAIASLSGKEQDVAKKFGIPKAYDNYEALLEDPDIDAVYIPLPNHLHKEWAIKAAEKGKHVISEKPATLTAVEAREVVDVCKKNGVKYMEAFMYQFHSQHERVKEIMASGEIGDIQLVKASFSFYMKDQEVNVRMDPKMGGGALYDIGSYCIHTIRNILNDEPEKAYAEAVIDPTYGVDTSAFGILQMKNTGIRAMFDCSFTMPFRTVYEIIGKKGTITVPRAYRPDQNDHEGLVIVEVDGEKREEKIFTDQYKEEVEHFSQAILNDTEPLYSGEDTVKNMQAIDLCYQSIHQKS